MLLRRLAITLEGLPRAPFPALLCRMFALVRVNRLLGCLVAACACMARSSVAAEETRPAKLDYNFDIRPILADRCFVCHGPDKGTRKADLRLDLAEAAIGVSEVIVRGKPEESELVRRITSSDDEERMPPPESKLHLTKNEIEVLRRWVAEGAEYKQHWAYLPLPKEVPLPAVRDSAWPAGAIDRFILARLEREGLAPSPAASKEDWLRRVTFDLTGLPPTLAEVDAFLADESQQAYEKVVDRLLASPRFGERMALDWIDAARYADSFGYQADGDMHVWPWRDWVIKAFNENLPYDRFLTWQIAGDLVASAAGGPTPGQSPGLPEVAREQRLATAFNRLHRMTNEGGSIPEEWRNEYVSDRVHTLGTAVLGLTLECTRCHDHKYDPFTMRDYYGLGAFFNSIDEWGTYDNSNFRPTPTLALPTAEQEQALAMQSEKVRALEKRLEDLAGSREAAFQSWLAASPRPDVAGLVAHYSLDAVEGGNQLANTADPKNHGTTSSANQPSAGKVGGALQFTGDDPANFPNVLGALERWQPYTIAFWLKAPTELKHAMILHRTSGTDTGFHGTEVALDDGRLVFSLIRFWPGNAIAVHTSRPLAAEEWTHVMVVYDGSSTAAGMSIYVNGTRAETEIIRDRLTKNLEAGGSGITFGERFRSTGLKNGQIDEVRVYDRALSPIEAAHLCDDKALVDAVERKDADALRPYYLAAVDSEAAALRGQLKQARQEWFGTQTAVFESMAMEEMPEPRPAYILHRGAYDAPKDQPVGRQTPAVLPPLAPDAPRNRLGLAQWLTHPDHPLTARVAVNRYGQLFFGRGNVATTENFGIQGAIPTHPELLDRLARDFVNSGWDVKALCKRMVLSATYRQRSAASPELRQRDPDNQFLARGPTRRLWAENLRDAAFFTSGLLVEKIGGPPVKPPQPPGLWKGMNAFLPEYVPDQGEGRYRRSMYTFWRRTSPPPNMLALDAPGREVCTVRRQATNTPTQPLVLLNDPQFVEAAVALGERMFREGGDTLSERLEYGFRTVATRRPSEQEQALLRRLYEDQQERFQKDPDSASRFLKASERKLPGNLDPRELAAMSVVASALLNVDAAVMVR